MTWGCWSSDEGIFLNSSQSLGYRANGDYRVAGGWARLLGSCSEGQLRRALNFFHDKARVHIEQIHFDKFFVESVVVRHILNDRL
jgi:hypothetical protein